MADTSAIYAADNGAPPRPAAVMVLLDTAHDGRVLLVRRNDRLAFMGGHHAFPGGRVDPGDGDVPVRHAPSREESPFIVAGVRELFEEAGILLANHPPVGRKLLEALRRELLAGRRSFLEVLAVLNAYVDAGDFLPAGRWVTPVFSPIRYDTRYYCVRRAEFPETSPMGKDAEITESEWMAPFEALRRGRAGLLRLSTPVTHILRSLAALSFEDALERMRRTTGNDPSRADFIEPRAGVAILPLRTNTLPPATHTNCIVIGWEQMVVIDPGAFDPAEQDRLVARLHDFEALGGEVKALLLTHDHDDHTGALPRLQEEFGVPVWAHEGAVADSPVPVDRVLSDNEVLEIPGDTPWRLRCLHTPGHHPGHLCFFEETTGALVGGDLFAHPGTILISADHGGDMTAYLDSLRRVAALPGVTTAIPAHGWPVPGEEGYALLESLITHRLNRETRILAALAAGARNMDELIARAYDDTPQAAWPLARLQCRAHLVRLGKTVD